MAAVRYSLLVFTLAACGGSSATPAKPAEPAPAAPSAFKDMNADQRMAFMKDVVMPKMAPLWAAFDPKLPALECKTCHGKGADDGSFEMPSAEIPVLPGTEEAFMAYLADPAHPDHPVWAKFMGEQVTPTMAGLLQMTPFDPKTMTGEFGCGTCHTTNPPHPKH
ncbi:MAG: hypothetical protein JWP01_4159 [Myxococcales bacterium]|nr:hypothetical protein [Myxococcales bacterium]